MEEGELFPTSSVSEADGAANDRPTGGRPETQGQLTQVLHRSRRRATAVGRRRGQVGGACAQRPASCDHGPVATLDDAARTGGNGAGKPH